MNASKPNGKIGTDQQVDHIIDLQFREGKDIIPNMRPLDSTVNQSLDKQIETQLKKLANEQRKVKIKVKKVELEGC